MKRATTWILASLAMTAPCWAARTFDGATQYFRATGLSDPFGAYPFTLAAWVKADAVGTSQEGVVWIGVSGATSSYWAVGLVAGDPNTAFVNARNTTSKLNQTSNNWAHGTWHHVAAVFASATERYVYLDGSLANRGSGTDSVTYSTSLDSFCLGMYGKSGGFTYFFKGAMAEAGIWNIALSSDEVDDLAVDKYAPGLVAEPNLIAWWKLAEASATDSATDEQGTYTLTDTGDPGVTDHPPGINYTIPAPHTNGFFDVFTYALTYDINDADGENVLNKSGAAYDPVSGKVFVIRNDPNVIREFTASNGSLSNESAEWESPFNDPEGICYTGGHADGDWAVVNEQPYGSSYLLLFDYTAGADTQPAAIAEYDLSDVTGETGTYGLEGVAYDSVRDEFYVSMQSMSTGGLWKVELGTEPNCTVTKLFDWSTLVADSEGTITTAWFASDIFHGRTVKRPNSIFVLANNATFTSGKIIEVSYTGSFLSMWDVPGDKTEGFCFLPDTYDLFLVSDNNTDATVWRYEATSRIRRRIGIGLNIGMNAGLQ